MSTERLTRCRKAIAVFERIGSAVVKAYGHSTNGAIIAAIIGPLVLGAIVLAIFKTTGFNLTNPGESKPDARQSEPPRPPEIPAEYLGALFLSDELTEVRGKHGFTNATRSSEWAVDKSKWQVGTVFDEDQRIVRVDAVVSQYEAIIPTRAVGAYTAFGSPGNPKTKLIFEWDGGYVECEAAPVSPFKADPPDAFQGRVDRVLVLEGLRIIAIQPDNRTVTYKVQQPLALSIRNRVVNAKLFKSPS